MSEQIRIEKDTIGEIEVPAKALWGAQTQRSIKNFSISQDRMPLDLIYALAKIKQVAAIVNARQKIINDQQRDLIINAVSEIVEGKHDNQFPLKVWQTGSGTQTNMNLNEVISNLASEATNQPLGSYQPLHPNDHVNRSQSTNDTFPSAIQIAVAEGITKRLLPEVGRLIKAFDKKSNNWNQIIKIGRTHLQDAVPLTLGQEVSAWRDQLKSAYTRLEISLAELYQLPLGGTAVGTGINAPSGFGEQTADELARLTNMPFRSAPNKFAIMASHDGLVNVMSQLRLLAITLLKIVNDIRLLSCGPRAGLAELILPANEPGSSIMPGKVNPTQCEAMAMVCSQVIGLDVAVGLAGSGGHLQMNAYKPLIGFNVIHSLELLHDACRSCRIAMVDGIEPNREKIKTDLNQSLMLATALTPKIGYEKASEIAKLAHKEGISLKEAANKLNYLSEHEFNKLIRPEKMV